MTKLVNKVLIINGRRTSMRLCLSEWCALERICREEKLSRNRLIEIIENSNRVHLGLTYLTRLFTLFYFYNQSVRKNISAARKAKKKSAWFLKNSMRSKAKQHKKNQRGNQRRSPIQNRGFKSSGRRL